MPITGTTCAIAAPISANWIAPLRSCVSSAASLPSSPAGKFLIAIPPAGFALDGVPHLDAADVERIAFGEIVRALVIELRRPRGRAHRERRAAGDGSSREDPSRYRLHERSFSPPHAAPFERAPDPTAKTTA